TLETDRHRRSPSCSTVDHSGRSYRKWPQRKTCDKTLGSRRTSRQLVCEVRCGLFSDIPLLLSAGIFFPQALEFLVQLFIIDLLLLALHTVIFPKPGV